MKLPEVSIVIPCFNRENYIATAIESALGQGDCVEVIVIDDGSTDNSWREITRFDSVVPVRTGNAGVSAARNNGLARARGRFIQFLDSDDWLPDNAVMAMLNAASRLQEREIAVGSVQVRSTAAYAPQYGFSAWIQSGPISPQLLFRYTMHCGLPLFPRDALLECGGFDENLSLSEDYALAAKLHAMGYTFIQQPIDAYVLRDHDGARLSRGYGKRGFEKQLDALRTAQDLIGPAALIERGAMAEIAWNLGRAASREQHRVQAESLFKLGAELSGKTNACAPWPLWLLYRFTSPYQAERLLEHAKAAIRFLKRGSRR